MSARSVLERRGAEALSARGGFSHSFNESRLLDRVRIIAEVAVGHARDRRLKHLVPRLNIDAAAAHAFQKGENRPLGAKPLHVGAPAVELFVQSLLLFAVAIQDGHEANRDGAVTVDHASARSGHRRMADLDAAVLRFDDVKEARRHHATARWRWSLALSGRKSAAVKGMSLDRARSRRAK
jgi:hypothetical protein